MTTTTTTTTTATTLDSNVWGPHYWFVLLTMATSYPKHPNDVTKKNTTNLFKIYHYLCHPAQSAIILVSY